MRYYNTKDWTNVLFKVTKADVLNKLWWILIVIAAYAAGIAYLELEYWNLSNKSIIKNLPIMHSLLGFAISLVLVFRTNTAYDRWWEGRKLWGALVNNSRNLALKLSVVLREDQQEERAFFRGIIPGYAQALHQHLLKERTRIMLFDESEQTQKILSAIDKEKHVPNQVAGLIYEHVKKLYREGSISGEVLLFLNSELQSFTDICGACERIKNTPIPSSYGIFIKRFVLIYLLTLPWGYVFQLGYWVVPVVVFITYVLASLELIAEEIEDPFGGDENDLPTYKMADNIRKSVEEIL
ncbi:bestrophin family protein [Niabella aquatica]